jgi:hypothetical protein
MLREYHALLAAGRHDEAALWMRPKLDRGLLEEATLSWDIPLAAMAELMTFSGGRTSKLLGSGTLAPLPPDEEIELHCENWLYTALDRRGVPVLRLEDDETKSVPFCLSRREEGWFVACI